MNIKQLKYFKEIVTTGNYLEASLNLGIAQSTLSQAIINLEAELETTLFYTDRRKSILTDSGKILYQHTKSILTNIDTCISSIHNFENGIYGTIRIGIVGSFGIGILPRVLSILKEKSPDNVIDCNISQGNTNELLAKLKSKEIELAICSYSDKEFDIIFSKIRIDRFVLVVSHDHPLASTAAIHLEDTFMYPFVSFSEHSALRPIINKIFSEFNTNPLISFNVDDAAMLLSLVEANLGIALIPDIYLIPSFNVKVLEIHEQYFRYVYCAILKNTVLSPVAQRFFDTLLDNFHT